MEKQEEKKIKLMAWSSTCFDVRRAPPTRAVSVVAGEVGPGAVDVDGGSRALGSTPGGPPMLPEWLEWGSADQRENR